MKNLLKKFNEGEHLIRVIDPDIWQFVPTFIWIIIPLFYSTGILYIFYTFRLGQIGGYALLGLSVVLLFLYARFLRRQVFSTYFLITNERLIYLNYRGFFKKHIVELRYPQMRTISCHFDGLIPSLFKVGAIIIDHGGTHENIILEYVKHPQTVQDLIMKLQREYSYVRQSKEKEIENGQSASSALASNGYLSARDLLLFLGKMLSIEEQKRANADIGHNTSVPVSHQVILPEPDRSNTHV